MAKRFPNTFYNPTSILGGVIALITFISFIFLVVLGYSVASVPVYFGIITFLILPIILIIGLLLIFVGMIFERRRRLKGGEVRHLICIDSQNPSHRRGVILFFVVLITFLLSSGFGSYQAFQYSESVEFCGTLCHEVMEPEYTAYQTSAHARVKCAECHIGEGADWFVKSKLSGAYQVYAVLANVYPRPIPTPIKNLRPAQETCEQCHWPQYFFSEKKKQKTYFKKDEKNSPWTISLLMKIGGGSPDVGPTAGIHWHMNIMRDIVYVANDSMRQQIPWIRTIDHNGNVAEYFSTEIPTTKEEIETKEKYKMDCIDCHNRPSHNYKAPTEALDLALALKQIDPTLPNIKSISVDALSYNYSTKGKAIDSIRTVIESYYRNNYKDIAQSRIDVIKNAVLEVQKIYTRNFFPEMNVSWKVYPENIGHMTNAGCFRCHDGKHVSPFGRVISKDCNSCHTILYQGTELSPKTLITTGFEFKHPEDIGDEWKTTNCNECHTGQ